MELIRLLTRANSLLLQGAYEGAEVNIEIALEQARQLQKERDEMREMCVDILGKLCESLPFVEDSLESNLFKPNFVKAKTKSIRESITKAEKALGGSDGN